MEIGEITGSDGGIRSSAAASSNAQTGPLADERATLARLLGPRAKGYLRVYDRRVVSGRRYPISWSWFGLILSTAWALYRRLYGITLLANIVVLLTVAMIATTPVWQALGAWSGLASGVPLALFLALFGRALVVEYVLRRMAQSQAPDTVGAPAVAAELPVGPLRGLPAIALTIFAGSILAVIGVTVARTVAGLGLVHRPAMPTMEPEAVFTGILALDRPIGMVLVNLVTIYVIVVGRRFIADRMSWPAVGAVALGFFGGFLALLVPYAELEALLPVAAQARLLALTYLLIGPSEEAIKFVLLLALIRRWEPVRDPKIAMVATVLVGAGFGLLENLLYMQLPVGVLDSLIGRLLLPGHILLASITALGVRDLLRTGRRWPLALAWVGAALLHGAFDHSALGLGAIMFPDDPTNDLFLRALGIDPAAIVDAPHWPMVVEAIIVAVSLLVAGCAFWRCLRGEEDNDPTHARPVPVGGDR